MEESKLVNARRNNGMKRARLHTHTHTPTQNIDKTRKIEEEWAHQMNTNTKYGIAHLRIC